MKQSYAEDQGENGLPADARLIFNNASVTAAVIRHTIKQCVCSLTKLSHFVAYTYNVLVF